MIIKCDFLSCLILFRSKKYINDTQIMFSKFMNDTKPVSCTEIVGYSLESGH